MECPVCIRLCVQNLVEPSEDCIAATIICLISIMKLLQCGTMTYQDLSLIRISMEFYAVPVSCTLGQSSLSVGVQKLTEIHRF